jgi:hypothetical protein
LEPYPDTPWSLIVQAGTDGQTQRALFRTLLQQYWQPVHAVLRAQVDLPAEQLQALLAEFFAEVVGSQWLRELTPEQGQFRTALRSHLIEFLDSGRAAQVPKSVRPSDMALAKELDLPRSEGEPAQVFDEQWTLLVFLRAVETLKSSASKEAARAFVLVDVEAEVSEAQLARAMGSSVAQAQAWLRTGRAMFRRLITDAVRQYVADDAHSQEELDWLLH